MMKKAGFLVSVVVLLLIITVLIAATARLQSNSSRKTEEAYYVQLERKYVKEMEKLLNTAGFQNSGIMLTRTVYEDNRREYHIVVHNGRFDSLSASEKEDLVRELKEIGFIEEDCSFIYSLTGNA
ncbi:MAG: hypothetical protein J1E65_06330 [Lachnospiraceae bacterium]|nr:hypothetical protein [Lachnospiraceae bacterium]